MAIHIHIRMCIEACIPMPGISRDGVLTWLILLLFASFGAPRNLILACLDPQGLIVQYWKWKDGAWK